MFKSRLIALSALVTLTAGPAFAADVVKTGEVTQTVKFTTDIFKMIDEDSVTVEFAPGSKTLTQDSVASLNRFAKVANNEGKVEKLIVASWSDKAYPLGDEKLTKDEVKLAKERNAVVEKVLKGNKVAGVSTYNMAEKPSWFAREFDTKGDLLKTGGIRASTTDQLYRQIGERLQTKGGAGKTVVVAKFKNEVATN